MNNLNSLILEGKIVSLKENENFVTVTIETTRQNKGAEVAENFSVFCYGALMEVMKHNFQEKLGFRLVGRLSRVDGEVGVIAEHIEFKPKSGSECTINTPSDAKNGVF